MGSEMCIRDSHYILNFCFLEYLGHGDGSSQKSPKRIHGIGPICQVAAGSSHTIALSKDGLTVWTFGAGDNGL